MLTAEVYTKNALVNAIINPRLRLKYPLKELFVRFCGCEEQISRAKAHLSVCYGIPMPTISYDINLRASEVATIPASRLNIYASYFGIDVNSLENTRN